MDGGGDAAGFGPGAGGDGGVSREDVFHSPEVVPGRVARRNFDAVVMHAARKIDPDARRAWRKHAAIAATAVILVMGVVVLANVFT